MTKQYVCYEVEYEEGAEAEPVTANMPLAGGKVTAVYFGPLEEAFGDLDMRHSSLNTEKESPIGGKVDLTAKHPGPFRDVIGSLPARLLGKAYIEIGGSRFSLGSAEFVKEGSDD